MGTIPTHQYKTCRRQNRSCDQCRRSKRACDAPFERWNGCSNCLRLGKLCSFEDAQKRNARDGKSHHGTRMLPRTSGVQLPHGNPNTEISGNFSAVSYPSPHQYRPNNVATTGSSLPLATYFDRVDNFLESRCPPPAEPQESESYAYDQLSNTTGGSTWNWTEETNASDPTSELFNEGLFSEPVFDIDPLYHNFRNGDYRANEVYEPDNAEAANDRYTWKRRTFQPTSPVLGVLEPSLAEKTNKFLISTSLNRIYGDTLENALLCWLTERTCPYNNEGIDRPMEHRTDTTNKYGMICRIQRLDRASCVLNDRPLTPRENRLASHALHATIMAFAAQWSYPSSTSMSSLSNGRVGGRGNTSYQELGQLMDASLFDFAEEKLASFDRSLQEALWNEAHRALHQAIGIDSFQVAFAQVIFGFTQRPLSREDFLRLKEHGKGATDYFGSSVGCRASFACSFLE